MTHPWQRRDAQSAIIQWDVGTWKYGLEFWDREHSDLRGRLGLEIGGRDGGLSLFLALKGCRVICSDIDGPTPRAPELHETFGVSDLVSYAAVDVLRIPYPDEHFDVVILKSVLAALGAAETLLPQRQALCEIRRVLKTGGTLLFAENMRGSALHLALRRRFNPWGKNCHYFTVSEIEDLLSGFRATRLSFRGFAATLGRREWQRSLLHAVDRVLLPALPKAFRYVVFASATK